MDSLVVDLTRLKWRCLLASAVITRLWGKFTSKVIQGVGRILAAFFLAQVLMLSLLPVIQKPLSSLTPPAVLAIFKLAMRLSVLLMLWVSPTGLLPIFCSSHWSQFYAFKDSCDLIGLYHLFHINFLILRSSPLITSAKFFFPSIVVPGPRGRTYFRGHPAFHRDELFKTQKHTNLFQMDEWGHCDPRNNVLSISLILFM